MWFSGSLSSEIQTINLIVIKKKKKKERKTEQQETTKTTTTTQTTLTTTTQISNEKPPQPIQITSPSKQWMKSSLPSRLSTVVPKERGNFLLSRRISDNDVLSTTTNLLTKQNIEKPLSNTTNLNKPSIPFNLPPSPTNLAGKDRKVHLQASKKSNIHRLSTSIGLNVHAGEKIFQRSKSTIMKVWIREKEKDSRSKENFNDWKLNRMIKRFNYTPENSLKLIVMGDCAVGLFFYFLIINNNNNNNLL